jgi:hypothetical protein
VLCRVPLIGLRQCIREIGEEVGIVFAHVGADAAAARVARTLLCANKVDVRFRHPGAKRATDHVGTSAPAVQRSEAPQLSPKTKSRRLSPAARWLAASS